MGVSERFLASARNVTNWSWNTIFETENTSWIISLQNYCKLDLFEPKPQSEISPTESPVKLPSAEADWVKSALNEEFIPDAFRIVSIDPEIVELLPFWACI